MRILLDIAYWDFLLVVENSKKQENQHNQLTNCTAHDKIIHGIYF